MAVWREGVTGPLAGNAVDMALRLDDAAASPTGPNYVFSQEAKMSRIIKRLARTPEPTAGHRL
jgi:hypothetical protein